MRSKLYNTELQLRIVHMLVVRSSSMHFLTSADHVYICNHVVALAQVKVGI